METLLAQLNEGSLCIDHILPTDWSTLIEAAKNIPLRQVALVNATWNGSAESGVLNLLRDHHATLNEVCFENVHLSAASARVYAEVLPWSTLKSLSLAKNNLGPRGTKVWGEYLKNAKQMQSLDFESCGMGHFGAQALGQVLPSTLLSLNLSHNKLGADGIWKMASRFALLQHLEVLDLSHNQMGDDGCLESARNIPRESLQKLCLGGNAIGDNGVVELINVLPNFTKLVSLDLSNNRLGNPSAKLLGTMLRQCSSLEELDLSYNRIGDKGCAYLVEGLLPPDDDESETEEEEYDDDWDDVEQEMGLTPVDKQYELLKGKESCLRVLRLDHNSIGDEGATSLVEHMDQIRLLQNVSLDGNIISEARMRILQMLLKHRSTVAKPRKSCTTDTSLTTESSEREEEDTITPVESSASDHDKNRKETEDETDVIEVGRQILLSMASSEDDGISALPMTYLQHLTSSWTRVLCHHGAFGRLYQAVDEESGMDNMLWLIRRIDMSSPGKMDAVRKAVLDEMSHFQHPSIAPLSATSVTEGCHAFMYEIPDESAITLRKCLSDPEIRRGLSWSTRLHIAWSIADALEFLHSDSPGRKAAVHGDLNPDSIFLSPNCDQVYLLDAGLSRVLATDRSRFVSGEVVFGTRSYRCPRYERGSISYDASCDIFSLGIILAELMTSRLQRSKDPNNNLAYDVYYDCILARQPLRTDPAVGPMPKILMHTWGQITLACMSPVPHRRPTASTVAQILNELKEQRL